ncbi:MAG: beta-N-acetylhexosaminidase, partial [Phycisphaerae bacterium]|nr:beta-N-acetylhexosaminidase [Gemmatimonadaceae bacterium]
MSHRIRWWALPLMSFVVAAPSRAQGVTPLAPVSPSLANLQAHRVVPLPVSVIGASTPPFVLSATTMIIADGSAEVARSAEFLARVLRKSTGFALPVSRTRSTRSTTQTENRQSGRVSPASTQPLPNLPTNVIVLRVNASAASKDEGYTIDITSDTLRITAANPAGLFFGVATLRQLLPFGIEAEQSALRLMTTVAVPAGRITDQPRFAWRGSMLDVARHFFTVDEVKQHIDVLALYKFNTLHLHLTDDQGWRIQIAGWPKLTRVGGSSEVGGGPGGFYTKVDYANIVQYAAARYITIVPEIDMPGHTNAAIAAYPGLGCSRATPGIFGPGTQPAGVYTGIRVGWSALCANKELTYEFVDGVVRELAAMTPGKYIHIGGDEVEVLTREQYARFVERAERIVNKYGKTMIGWEEVGKAKLRPTS